ncbi:MAG: 5'-nucleotidase C-terminal domain-containing protein [Hydrotalea sp.]|nr:5'-nucleotidase C-terminal domain-containing protein [Hydrotalea sp.]
MKKILSRLSIIGLIVLMIGCGASKTMLPWQYKPVNIQLAKELPSDTSMERWLTGYSGKLRASMDQVIGTTTQALSKAQPESELGNYLADALLEMAKREYKREVHAAFINYGGVRAPLPKGNITVGNIFEVMPFDNLLVLQEMNGKVLQVFLDKIAARGGWPIAGIEMKIKDKKAVEVKVQGKPLDENTVYVIANSDYVATGGDDNDILKTVPVISSGYLMRDAFIAYTKMQTEQKKNIGSPLQKRISYANAQ